MTSEVCLMNRLAVVLAADSATTVTRWDGHGKEERYFKGANKIFQLSNYDPVGMMIFDSADIMSVPWELVVKEFRNHLSHKSFNDIAGYAAEFFSFLDDNMRLFPQHVRDEAFIIAARSASLDVLFQIQKDESHSADEKTKIADKAVAERLNEVNALPAGSFFANDAIAEKVATFKDELEKRLEECRIIFGNYFPDDLEELVLVGITDCLKRPFEYFGKTGLVFAGFGDHNIFPSCLEYSSCGIVLEKHVSMEITRLSIDHDVPAALSSFAQTSMSETFSLGLSQDVYHSIMMYLTRGLHSFAEELCKDAGIDIASMANIDALIANSRKNISDAVLNQANQDHALPLRRVLGVLPIDEMAELAEMLINLQSVKEKVTKPSETVGGPIDVAVITKSEGLIWIKRKHFFDASINPRFLHRQSSIY